MTARRVLSVDRIAEGVYCIGPWGRTDTAVYLVRSEPGWTLIDAGWAGDGPRIQAAVASVIEQRKPARILLTHVHPDHQGDARTLAASWECPVWVSPAELPIALRDFDAMRATAMPLDQWLILPMMRAMGRKRREKVFAANTLAPVVQEFDPVGPVPGLPDWICVPTPGHTAGHVSFFRPTDRVLISGDALVTTRIDTIANLLAHRSGLSGPPWYTTWDSAAARESITKLAALEPNVVAGGHGRPLAGSRTPEAVAAFATRISRTRSRGSGRGTPRH